MATSCTALRVNLARQTPVFAEAFLDDYISDMVNVPFVGRHQSEVWDYETDRVYFDKLHVEQANYLTPWQVIDASECAANSPCDPPSAYIGYGSTRDSAVMEQIKLRSQLFCLEQLARVPKIGQQMKQIYKVIRNIPLGFTGDFVRARTVSYHDSLQICGSAFGTLAITSLNTTPNLSTINLGGAGNLPTSQLTWQYLTYLSQILGLRGYDRDSGIAKGMRNIITHSKVWQNLVGQNPEIKSQLHLVGVKDVSPLYELGTGINADPFGPYAPTFDEHQIRFVTNGGGLLQRVLPYLNTPATTGEKPIYNSAWLNSRYGLSVISHKMATKVYTTKPKKIHEMIPQVNSAMYGAWDFVNPQGALIYPAEDGTVCTKNNETQQWFYWLCLLQLGFEYDQRDLNMPILHLIDAGQGCMVDSPVCGDAPQYVVQNYEGGPDVCDA
jgi:hypothetical protein